MLDGGFAAWVAADRPVASGDVPAGSGTVTIKPGSLPTVDAAEAAALAARGRLVDVRAPERFRGEVEPMDPVAGHIPGAINIPTAGNVRSDGAFHTPVLLRRRFAEADLDVSAEAEPVGVYCGSGVTAAHTVLAMRAAGIPAVLYPGSWSEWIVDPQRPVAVG
ncbi:MAG TPA: rhodanese-like domain-containing protein [Jatrophihabitans sp.]